MLDYLIVTCILDLVPVIKTPKTIFEKVGALILRISLFEVDTHSLILKVVLTWYKNGLNHISLVLSRGFLSSMIQADSLLFGLTFNRYGLGRNIVDIS